MPEPNERDPAAAEAMRAAAETKRVKAIQEAAKKAPRERRASADEIARCLIVRDIAEEKAVAELEQYAATGHVELESGGRWGEPPAETVKAAEPKASRKEAR